MNNDISQATEKLLAELEKSRRSGEQNGWLDDESVFRELGEKYKD